MADYQRNLENQREFSLSLQAGKNELELWFDDLAERDIRFFFQLDYLDGEPLRIALATPLTDAQVKEMEQLLDGVSFEHPVYNRGTIRLVFPQPASTDYCLHVNVLGILSRWMNRSRSIADSPPASRWSPLPKAKLSRRTSAISTLRCSVKGSR